MTEVPKFVPARQDFIIPITPTPDYHPELPPHLKREDFTIPLTPTPNYYPELPYYLIKDVLKRIRFEEGVVPESLWHKRGIYIEKRVQGIISKLSAVKNVIRNGNNSPEDILGHDITTTLHDNTIFHIQVKSSRYGIVVFKQAIRNKYFPNDPNSMELVKKWMTNNRIILINGAETKSDKEILKDSYYPQLERMQQKTLEEQNPEASGQLTLFPKLGPIQIFPEAL